MAKMFYTITETAQALGMSEDEVKQLVAQGQLQQFRDGDQIMFKTQEVDGLGASSDADPEPSSNEPELVSDLHEDDASEPIPLVEDDVEVEQPAIELSSGLEAAAQAMEPTQPPEPQDSSEPLEPVAMQGGDIGQADPLTGGEPHPPGGINVFDGDEITPADPAAQTQMTSPLIDDDQIELDNIPSGSGLLDLTRETDDTSLGTELLDELYAPLSDQSEQSDPQEPEGEDDTGAGSSGVFDGAIAVDFGSSSSGLENLQGSDEPATVLSSSFVPVGELEIVDPLASGLSTGMLLGASAVMIITLIVTIFALADVPSGITGKIGHTSGSVLMYTAMMGMVSVVLGAIGLWFGKAQQR